MGTDEIMGSRVGEKEERVRIEPWVVLIFNGQGKRWSWKADSQEVGQTVIRKPGDWYVLEIQGEKIQKQGSG